VAAQSSSFGQDPTALQEQAARARHSREDEAELIREMQAGSESAFATFYDRFAAGLFSMIYCILHDQRESEDVLQESFVQMWKKITSYNPARSSLFTWAVMISRHKAIDRLRARQRQGRLVEEAILQQDSGAPAEVGRGDDALERRDERGRVRLAFAQLSEAQREALDLAFFAGLTQTEIAEKLGAPLGTVKARIRRGLLALRELLGKVSP
jgi:RNA polymerase sigma-70 factor (ECF subfamily)